MTLLFILTYILAAGAHLTHIVNLKGTRCEWLESLICAIAWPIHIIGFWLVLGVVSLATYLQHLKNK